MKKIIRIICVVLISFVISGCFSTGNKHIKDLTQASIDKIIIKGRTTSTEILEKFDSASIIEPTLSGGEYWWYSYSRSVIDPLSYTVVNFIPNGSFYSHVLLLIEFSKEGTVSNYKFRRTSVQSPLFRIGPE